MEYFDDFEKCQEEEMSEEGSAVDQIRKIQLQKKLAAAQRRKGAGTFHSASQSKEGSVGFGTSQHPIFMKLLPDHLWH